MCDCYDHKCIVCGDSIPMHLEDFSTEREEVAVFHEGCLKKAMKVWEARMGNPESLCHFDMKEDVVVISLTKNAMRHQEGNYPNC